MNKRDNPNNSVIRQWKKCFCSHISPSGQFKLGVKCRKWQQNTLDLSDPINIFLNPCFSNRPLPGMLVLHMTRLSRMAEITHRQCDVGSPPSRTTAVVQHDVPLSVSASTTLLPAPCNSHGACSGKLCSPTAPSGAVTLLGRTQGAPESPCQLSGDLPCGLLHYMCSGHLTFVSCRNSRT